MGIDVSASSWVARPDERGGSPRRGCGRARRETCAPGNDGRSPPPAQCITWIGSGACWRMKRTAASRSASSTPSTSLDCRVTTCVGLISTGSAGAFLHQSPQHPRRLDSQLLQGNVNSREGRRCDLVEKIVVIPSQDRHLLGDLQPRPRTCVQHGQPLLRPREHAHRLGQLRQPFGKLRLLLLPPMRGTVPGPQRKSSQGRPFVPPA